MYSSYLCFEIRSFVFLQTNYESIGRVLSEKVNFKEKTSWTRFFPKLSGIKVIFNYPETYLKITQELNTKKYHFSRITKFHPYSISHLFRCILHFSKISSLNGCLKKVQNPNFFEVEKRFIDRFYAIGLFLYPLRFSDVFREHGKRPVTWKVLKTIKTDASERHLLKAILKSRSLEK